MNTCENCQLQVQCFKATVKCINLKCNKEFTYYFCSPECEKSFDEFYSGSVTCDEHEHDACF